MKPDPLKAISVPQEPGSAVRDALWSFSGVCGIYPHRDGTVPGGSEILVLRQHHEIANGDVSRPREHENHGLCNVL